MTPKSDDKLSHPERLPQLTIKRLSLENRLQPLSIDIKAGQVVHLLGENGAGKSSLLHLLSGLIPADDGVAYFGTHNLHQLSLAQLASFRGFQEQNHASQFPLRVSEALDFYAPTRAIPEEVEHALEIRAFLHRPLNTLSGGESRRVHVARVLLQVWPSLVEGRGLVLLDEPTQGLDYRHQHLLFKLLLTLASRGNTVIVSHHDLNLCHQYAHQVCLLKQGKLLACGPIEEVMSKEMLALAFSCQVEKVQGLNGVLFQTYLG